MIARVGTGHTKESDAQAFADIVEQTGLADMKATAGNRGAFLFKRVEDGLAEFVVLSL